MLTKDVLKNMLTELLAQRKIGCIYDFKERFGVALNSLEALELVKTISTKIPDCGEHCEAYKSCPYKAIYVTRKSKSKYTFTDAGLTLTNKLLSVPSEDLLKNVLVKPLTEIDIVTTIHSAVINTMPLSIEALVTALLKRTKMNITIIRTVTKDILDLLCSVDILQIKEGLIYNL